MTGLRPLHPTQRTNVEVRFNVCVGPGAVISQRRYCLKIFVFQSGSTSGLGFFLFTVPLGGVAIEAVVPFGPGAGAAWGGTGCGDAGSFAGEGKGATAGKGNGETAGRGGVAAAGVVSGASTASGSSCAGCSPGAAMGLGATGAG